MLAMLMVNVDAKGEGGVVMLTVLVDGGEC